MGQPSRLEQKKNNDGKQLSGVFSHHQNQSWVQDEVHEELPFRDDLLLM